MAGVLNVCSANRCRSAMAERLLRELLPLDVAVASAGTRARPGEPIWPAAATELSRRGASPYGFESAPIVPALVRNADLVLTATRAHRDELVAAHPVAFGRVFTWRELAWLLTGLDPAAVPGRTVPERLRALPETVSSRRSQLPVPRPEELDVLDPVEGVIAVELAAEQIAASLGALAAVVRGPFAAVR